MIKCYKTIYNKKALKKGHPLHATVQRTTTIQFLFLCNYSKSNNNDIMFNYRE